MAVTGRLVALALLATLVAAATASAAAVLLVDAALLAAALVDVALAASVRELRLERAGDTAVRLGEPATVSLRVTNPEAAPSARRSATRGRRRPARSVPGNGWPSRRASGDG